MMNNYNYKSSILKSFYSFRNGAIAESLKKQGLPFKNIFGLLLPQLTEIATNFPKEITLAEELWNDRDFRESRLLAILLIPTDSITKDEILSFIQTVKTTEETDILCFKVLRNLPYAEHLFKFLSETKEPSNNLKDYLLEMFRRNLEAVKFSQN